MSGQHRRPRGRAVVRVVSESNNRRHEIRKTKAAKTTTQHDVRIFQMKLAAVAVVLVALFFSCTGPTAAPTMCENTLNPGVTFPC